MSNKVKDCTWPDCKCLDYCENKDPHSINPKVLWIKALEHADELEHIDEEFPPDISDTMWLLRALSESLELSRRDYEVIYKIYETTKTPIPEKYAAWRISYQDSEQAAKSAYSALLVAMKALRFYENSGVYSGETARDAIQRINSINK